MAQNRSPAVMAQRAEPLGGLDFFPTPPWATRALCEHLERWGGLKDASVWEPACGAGDMVRPLSEYFHSAYGSDVHDHGWEGQSEICDFLFPGPSPMARCFAYGQPDWIVTNPPFRLAEEFALKAFGLARFGVALLVRTAFLEGAGRFARLFAPHRPQWVLPFCERVPMVKGRLDAKASTATSYAWVVWTGGMTRNIPAEPWDPAHFPALAWIPPCRARLERPGDYPAPPCAAPAPGPLFAAPDGEAA